MIRLVEAGFPCTLAQVLEHGVGKEKKRSIRDALASAGQECDPECLEGIHRDFQRLLGAAYASCDIKPQPGAVKVFRALRERGISIALATGHGRGAAETLLDRLGWAAGREYDLLVTASDVPRGRPDPEMILLAMARLGVGDPRAVAKVGDTVCDVQEGRNAGCGLCVGVATGAHAPARLAAARPDAVIGSLMELLPLL